LEVVPILLASTDIEYDVVHVDGGHTYECAMGDLMNIRSSLSPGGLVILDDSVAPEVGRALTDAIKGDYFKYHPINELYKSSYQAYLMPV
jgi:hypothetical protein